MRCEGIGSLHGGGIVELVLRNVGWCDRVASGILSADIEPVKTADGYAVGRHAVVFEASTIEQTELRSDLPRISEIKGEFVF